MQKILKKFALRDTAQLLDIFFKFKVKAVSISKALNLRKQHISLKRTFDINYFTSEVTTYLLN